MITSCILASLIADWNNRVRRRTASRARNFFSRTLSLLSMVAQGDTSFSSFLSFSPYRARRSAGRSSSHLCLSPPLSTYISSASFSLLSLSFSSFFLSPRNAPHTTGRKSRNRPAGNPPVIRSISSPSREGSAGSIGVL